MIRAVLGRFPRLRLAVAAEDVGYQREGLIRGPRVLPVTWWRAKGQGRIASTYPPSTRSAPPVVAEACSELR